jgi:hypothetical protein
MGFDFLQGICWWQKGSEFKPSAKGQYEFILTVSDDDDVPAESSMTVQVGDAVLEDDDDDDADEDDDD